MLPDKSSTDHEKLEAAVRAAHPDWNDAQVRREIRAMEGAVADAMSRKEAP